MLKSIAFFTFSALKGRSYYLQPIKEASYETDAAVYTVTVDVKDNGDGTLRVISVIKIDGKVARPWCLTTDTMSR